MELRHLRYFVRVADELHFGRAAAKLGISQPPLSQQIRALEEELGIDLFDRTSRRVRLTDAGTLFLVEARRTLDQAQHAADVARRIRQGEAGELAIGFATSVPFVRTVSAALARFRADHPSVHLTLKELGRDAQIAGVADGELDLGFVRGHERPVLPVAIGASMLQEEPMIVGFRDDHPLAALDRGLTLDDIADEPFVVYTPEVGSGFYDQLAMMLRRQGREMRIVQEVNGLGSMLGLVAAGLGITVLTRSLSALRAERVVYRDLDVAGMTSRLWMIRRPDLSLVARGFIRLLKDGEAG